VRRMAELSRQDLAPRTRAGLIEAGRGYVEMLSAHIDKEDNILYPIADDVLTGADQKELEKGFEEVEEKVMGPGAHEK